MRGPDEEAEHLRGCVVCPALTGRACSITDLTTADRPRAEGSWHGGRAAWTPLPRALPACTAGVSLRVPGGPRTVGQDWPWARVPRTCERKGGSWGPGS